MFIKHWPDLGKMVANIMAIFYLQKLHSYDADPGYKPNKCDAQLGLTKVWTRRQHDTRERI